MRIISYLFILLAFFACNKAKISKETDIPIDLDLDTLRDNQIYLLDSISESEFFALPENGIVFCDCFNEISIEDSKVSRNDSVLSFQLQNGNTKKLINNAVYHKNYCYKGFLEEINQWLVCEYCGDEHSSSFL